MLTGASIVKRELVRNLLSATQQLQPCGVDLSLRRVLRWTSPATVDFDNARRQAAATAELPFRDQGAGTGTGSVALAQGAYLVEFNETVHVPLDCMGQVFVRSSLWRSGALLTAGVVDAGYEGALGALLDIRNPMGIVLWRNAKLGQITMHRLEDKVAGYRGIYQFSASTIGRDGATTPASGPKT
ncbi:dUTPase domain-containing protein [Hirsutella rhossiliensis]|uniref:dUTPase domain-containing protein n=1 Tax=Hirsutella rhossiliensis TaxID=111463 RepID=A0A9P8N5E3_9HYPO|nr:dUTPase domain-containing protein [Hirsutella rhossiliensis]KAH0967948.1 dUTPase domain-containing protein [Hirsutella rhossiliensis]